MEMSGAQLGREEAFFELRFSPDVALASAVRRFVGEFYVHLLRDDDVVQKLATATHEMLENAIAYSVDGRTELWIVLRRQGNLAAVTLQTSNRASEARLALARRAFEEVLTQPDPAEMYLTLVRRAAKRRDGGSGLGLGRIRAESDLDLDYAIEGDRLTVTAQGLFRPAPGAAMLEA
jgi:hypothetical protein